ncbi:MAG: 30S ribosomal protein S16, partial [Candidatus Marinimicrobia bacterium]|nr:30S ribosomal protein S16 [Candidatus Neomarinimicrobiota bacterium]MBT7922515.1 30S ribosomal protein S16 [Candidatus Neomarinimicrobiota bacterium]
MATKIRLKRIGRRNRPFYRVVVMDSRNRRDGAAIEELGWFNPIEADKSYKLEEDRFLHWLKEGAQPSEAAHGLMKRSGLAHRWHLTQQGLDEKTIEKEMKKWALTREETLKNRAEKVTKKAEKAEEKIKAEAEAATAAEAAVEEAAAATEEADAKEDAPAEVEDIKAEESSGEEKEEVAAEETAVEAPVEEAEPETEAEAEAEAET